MQHSLGTRSSEPRAKSFVLCFDCSTFATEVLHYNETILNDSIACNAPLLPPLFPTMTCECVRAPVQHAWSPLKTPSQGDPMLLINVFWQLSMLGMSLRTRQQACRSWTLQETTDWESKRDQSAGNRGK